MKYFSLILTVFLLLGCGRSLDQERLGAVVDMSDTQKVLWDAGVKYEKTVTLKDGVVAIIFGYSPHPGAERVESLLTIQFSPGEEYLEVIERLFASGRGISDLVEVPELGKKGRAFIASINNGSTTGVVFFKDDMTVLVENEGYHGAIKTTQHQARVIGLAKTIYSRL
ncbi:MAG: hypothetical protein KJ950_14395 [Proteobacteria bacterium]|nr:hypothetical protein [Pseudomonadota bacterium]MBU1687886.1 hypothetical protein [Pseudomonadota bacterium]